MSKVFQVYRMSRAAGLAALLFLSIWSAHAAAPAQKVTFVFSGFNERTSFIFVAKDMRFFEEQGLDAQIVQVRNAPVAVSAMAAMKRSSTPPRPPARHSVRWRAGWIWFSSPASSTSWTATSWYRPRSPRQRISRVKHSACKASAGASGRFLCSRWSTGVSRPDRDKIQFRILGDQSVITQSLISGVVDGSYLGYSFSKMVQRHGFRVLADLAKVDIPYQGIGIAARKSFLEQSPDVAERTLKAVARAIAYYQDPAHKQNVASYEVAPSYRVEDAVAGYEAARTATPAHYSDRRRRAQHPRNLNASIPSSAG